MCKDVNKSSEVQVLGGWEPKVDFLPQNTIELNVTSKGFNLKAEGYSENFLLSLVSTLKEVEVKAEVVAKPQYLAPNAVLDPKYINPCEELEISPTYASKAPKVEATKPVYSTQQPTTSSIAEKFGDKSKELYAVAGVESKTPSNNDYYHTGIKYGDGDKPKYRCAYDCPKCGASGRHYIPFHVSRVSCHQCQTPLVVEPATELGKGATEDHRDENGNFLFAEVIDYTVASWDKSGKF